MEKMSLTRFAQTIGVAKSSIHARCKELGISTSAGLDDGAQLILMKEFDYKEPAPDPEVEPEAETAWGLSIIAPGHQSKVAPELGGAIELAQFGIESSEHFDDPVALAERAIEGLDQLEGALDLHLLQLEDKCRKTAFSAKKLAEKKDKFREKVLKAQIKSEVLELDLERSEESIEDDLSLLGKQQPA